MAYIKINGVTPTGIYVGSTAASAVYLGNVKVWEAGLPAKTMRFDFKYDHFDPTTLTDFGGIGATWTHVHDDIYDFYYNNTNWGSRTWSNAGAGGLFNTYAYRSGSSYVYPMTLHEYDVIDMNLEGVTDVSQLLGSAYKVKNLFSIRNTGSVTNFDRFLAHGTRQMLYTSIPLFDTSSATNVSMMCVNTRNVTTGALALYTQMSTQTTPPATYNGCFTNCGSDTVTGAAELAQIPTSWGGTMSSGFTVNSVGSNLYDAWDGNYCYKSQRITVPAGVSLSATASFVWDNTGHCNYHGSPDAVGNTAYLVLANPSDSTKYVVGTVQQGVWEEYSEWNSYINLPLTWSGTLSSMFTWGNLTMNDLRDSSGNVDIYVCCTGISGDAPNGGFNTIFEYSGDISDEGSVITVTVS